MKKIYFILLAIVAVCMAGCEEPNPAEKRTSFPRKHLIEHFTGEECGYCPDGMASIQEFLAATNKNYIWVSHHYGYGTDEYTIPANATIGKKLGIQGAPNVVFDRTKRRVSGTNAYGFHPGYLTEKGAVPLNDADTALANVIIDRTYDAATRELTLTVHGEVLSDDPDLLLSVLIKESGTVGAQHDYVSSWEGWSEFRHVKTVRTMLTAALGDVVEVVKGKYTATYTYTLPQKWVADNCAVVAYITSNMTGVQPIINAEQIAVVDGTDGGESLKAEGITMVPVNETYPEEGAPMANIEFTNANINSQYLASNGYVTLTLQAPATKIPVSGYSSYPYLQLFVFTKSAKLAAGTYPVVQDEYDYGMVAGGYRNDKNFELGGSMLYYVYNQSGSLYPMAQWLVVSGELIVGEEGEYTINATTLNGSTFTGTYAPAVAAPLRMAPMANKLQKSLFFMSK